MTSRTEPTTNAEAIPPAIPAQNGNGRYWLGIIAILWIIGRFVDKETVTSEVVIPYPWVSAIWGLGLCTLLTAILFARTNTWIRIAFVMASFPIANGFAKSINYDESLQVSAGLVAVMALIAVPGFYRARFMGNLWFRRQVLGVRILCLLILLTGVAATGYGSRLLKVRAEQQYEYLFFGIQQQLNQSLGPTWALCAPLELDDSMTSSARNRRYADLLNRQVALLENSEARVAAMEVPRKYRKMHTTYLDFLRTGITVNKMAASAAENSDWENQVKAAKDSFTKTVPALQNYLDAQRAVGLPISKELQRTVSQFASDPNI